MKVCPHPNTEIPSLSGSLCNSKCWKDDRLGSHTEAEWGRGGGAIIQITLAVFYWDQHVLIASDGTSCSCSIRKNRLFCWFSWWTFNKVTQNGSLKRLQFFLSFSTGHFIMFGWSRFNNTLSEVSCLRTQHQGSNLDHSIWRQTHN